MRKTLALLTTLCFLMCFRASAESAIADMTLSELIAARNEIETEIMKRLEEASESSAIPEVRDPSEVGSGDTREEPLYAGKYLIGTDLEPGKYIITCNEITGGSYMKATLYATEEDADNWNSLQSEYMNRGDTIYFNLKQDMVLKITDGSASIRPAVMESGTALHPGSYVIGEDIVPGSYLVSCEEITDGSYMKATLYADWQAMTNWNSVYQEYLDRGERMYFNLRTEGRVFKVADGFGTIESASADPGEIIYPGLYTIGTNDSADLAPGSYRIKCSEVTSGSYMKVSVYETEEDVRNYKSSSYEYISRNEEVRFRFEEDTLVKVADGYGDLNSSK